MLIVSSNLWNKAEQDQSLSLVIVTQSYRQARIGKVGDPPGLLGPIAEESHGVHILVAGRPYAPLCPAILIR